MWMLLDMTSLTAVLPARSGLRNMTVQEFKVSTWPPNSQIPIQSSIHETPLNESDPWRPSRGSDPSRH